jgi:hypothetical protein
MDDFRDALVDCDLTDIGLCGLPYTYDSGRSGVANVRVRLDRAVANSRWRDMFSNVEVQHIVSSRSNHCPLLVEIRKDAWDMKGPTLFRYEIM